MENNTLTGTDENGSAPSLRRRLSAPAARIFLGSALWASAVAFALSASALPGNDPYYHVALVRKMPESGRWIIVDFPWTTCSIWSEPFFDKEWLFHVFLLPFVSAGGIFGAKAATVALAAFAAAAWGFLLATLGCRRIFQCLLFALSATGYVFLARIDLCRPHLTSLIFLPLTLALAFRLPERDNVVTFRYFAIFIIKAFMFQKDHRVIITNRGKQ